MACVEKTDSLNLNHWQLCNKGNIFVIAETSSESPDIAKVNSSKRTIFNRQISSKSLVSLQIRFVNPAIYVEPLKPFKTLPRSKSTGLYPVERRCRINDESVASIIDDQPEVQRYSVNGNKIIKTSTSLSNFSLSQHDSCISVSKKQALDEWIKKKKLDILQRKKAADELELQKKMEEERLKQERAEKKKLECHNFVIWIRQKRKENLHKRVIAEKECELKCQIEELEAKTAFVKEIFLRQWYLKKEREKKALKKKEELRIQKLEAERQKNLEESLKAFKHWREKSKNRSRPATQGLLPHQQAKPRYINPIPWVVDQISSETDENQIANNEAMSNPIKSNIEKAVLQK